MLKMFKNFLESVDRKRRRDELRRGFEFAMSSLFFDKTKTKEELRQDVVRAKDFDDHTSFDEGITLALKTIHEIETTNK